MATAFLFADFFQRQALDAERTKLLLETFIDVCGALKVSDPNDPLSKTIARAVIGLAAEGERDPVALYERTLREISAGH